MGALEVISTSAAVISALGGAVAAFAAFRSAEAARVTQQAVASAEHRAALREIGITAKEVLIEAERISSRGNDLKLAYQSLFIFAGQPGSSRHNVYDKIVDERLKHASELSDYAKLFATSPEKLNGTPPEETDHVRARILNSPS